MKYIAFYREDKGCNSWTFCRSKTLDLKASNMADAFKEFKKFVKKNYYYGEYTKHGDTKVSDCVILEVNNSLKVNIDDLYTDINNDRIKKEKLIEEKLEREEYLRLKEKYEQV
jgi:hypothetical protein